LVKASGMEVAQGDDEPSQDKGEDDGRRYSVMDRLKHMDSQRSIGSNNDINSRLEAKEAKMCVDMMSQGRVLTLHKLDRRGLSSKKNVFVFYISSQSKLGILYWCEVGTRQEIRKQSIALHRITDLFIGKQTDVFAKADVEEEKCFSVITKHRTVNFEAGSQQDLDLWVAGINHILTASGVQMKETIQDDGRGDQTPGSKRHSIRKLSFMVNDQSKNPVELLKQISQRTRNMIEISNKDAMQMLQEGRAFTGYAENENGDQLQKFMIVLYDPGQEED